MGLQSLGSHNLKDKVFMYFDLFPFVLKVSEVVPERILHSMSKHEFCIQLKYSLINGCVSH